MVISEIVESEGLEGALPVMPSLEETSRAAILSNPSGEIMIVHDQPIEGVIQWVEYDVDGNSFSIIYSGGRIQDLGLKFDKHMRKNITNGRKVLLVHMVDGQIASGQRALLVVRDY